MPLASMVVSQNWRPSCAGCWRRTAGWLVSTASQEIRQGRLRLLREHGLSQAQARDYVWQTQEWLLVAPLLAHLESSAAGHVEMEERLRSLLEEVRGWAEDRQGSGLHAG